LRIRILDVPYTTLGIRKLPVNEEWSDVTIQFRPGEFAKAGASGLYLILQGTGTFSVRGMTLERRDAFQFSASDQPARGELLGNGGFRLGSAGWAVQRVVLGTGTATFEPAEGRQPILTQEESFDVRLGKDYILTIAGDLPPKLLNVSLFGDAKRFVHRFEVDAQTKQAHFRMKGPQTGFLLEQMPVFLELKTNHRGVVTAISLKEVDALSPSPPETISAAGAFSRNGLSVRRCQAGESVDLTVRVTGVKDEEPLRVTLHNLEGKTVWQHDTVARTQADGTLGSTWSGIVLPAGWYDLDVAIKGKSVHTLPAELAVLTPVPAPSEDAPFVLGAHLQYWFDVRGQGPDEEWVTYHALAAPEADSILMESASLGISSVRLHPPLTTKWWYVEPKPGEWRFGDDLVDTPLRNGISVLGLLDGSSRSATSAPAEKMVDYKPWAGGWGGYPPKDLNDWRRYVRTVVSHFKGRIHAWEIWNEPDHSMFLSLAPGWRKTRAETYAELVKAAAEEAHAIDPAIKIVSGAITASGKPFLDEAIARGMLADSNAVSFHGYGRVRGADRGTAAFTDLIGPLQEQIGQTGRALEIWDTEASVESAKEGRAGAAAGRLELKGLLVRRALGMSRLYLYSGYRKQYPLHEDYRMLWGFNDRPLVVQPMLATAQGLLGRMRFERVLIDEPQGRHVYLFREGGRFVAAGWTSDLEVAEYKLPSGVSGAIISETGAASGEFNAGRFPLVREVRYFSWAEAE